MTRMFPPGMEPEVFYLNLFVDPSCWPAFGLWVWNTRSYDVVCSSSPVEERADIAGCDLAGRERLWWEQ